MGDAASHRSRLGLALAISTGLLLVEAGGGLLSHSLALLADAGHVLADVAALTLSYVAARLAERGPSRRHTFGLFRAEILAAFVNAQVLLIACAAIAWEAIRRLASPEPVHSLPMAFFAVVALAGNLASLRILHSDRDTNLNVHGAFVEIAADALAAAAVLAAAGAIALTGRLWIDPALSLAIAAVIVPRAISLLRRSAHILLEGAPAHVDPEGLRSVVRNVPGVVEIHDLHVWTLTSGVDCVSLHAATETADPDRTLREIERRLREEAGIDHATIQIEAPESSGCPTIRRY
jgi:cobalt-zinc-cadmium efflux system protein